MLASFVCRFGLAAAKTTRRFAFSPSFLRAGSISRGSSLLTSFRHTRTSPALSSFSSFSTPKMMKKTTQSSSSSSSSSSPFGNGWLVGATAFGLAGLALYQLKENKEKIFSRLEAAGPTSSPSSSSPQSSVVSGMHPSGAFVTIRLNVLSNEQLNQVVKAAAGLPNMIKEVLPDESEEGELQSVLAGVGFGTVLWEKYCKNSGKALPPNFMHYQTKQGELGILPSTGGEILLHVKAATQSLAFELVKKFVESLPVGSVRSIEDRYGWQYQEGRDLSGFIDGTENPAVVADRQQAAIIPENGGSYAIHQVWVHKLPAIHSLAVEEQEKIIGRTKADSAKLEESIRPKTSHLDRMRDEHGKKIPIVRQSMPFGTVGGQHGLLFLAYSNNPHKFERMLNQMVGKGEGSHGKLSDFTMKFSTCVESNYYYVPSADELSQISS